MNNMTKMALMTGGKIGGGNERKTGGSRNGGSRMEYRGGSSDSMGIGYTSYEYDASYYDMPESRRRRDRLGRYMEGEDGPEMNGTYATMGYEETPEMRRANMHAVPKAQIGFAGAESSRKKFDHETAHEWTKGMKNADGSMGPHWSFDQAKAIMAQHNVSGIQPAEFWAVINALYSDYCRVAKKYGVDRPDFYMELAKAWLNDEDAVDDKAAAYFEYVVK